MVCGLVYGKTEKRTAIVDGRVRKTYKHGKPAERWEVMLKDHQDAYIDSAEFEHNQRQPAGQAEIDRFGRGSAVCDPGALLHQPSVKRIPQSAVGGAARLHLRQGKTDACSGSRALY